MKRRPRRLKVYTQTWVIRDVDDVAKACDEPRRKLDGVTVYPSREIMLDGNLSDRNHMVTALHEILHAVCPMLTETQVREASTVQATYLWRDGWRRARS